jgi:hypothetical protein
MKGYSHEEWEFAAGQVINCCPGASDEEGQGETENTGTGCAANGLAAEQSGGNVEGDIPAS